MLLAYTFGEGLAAAALVTFIFVWFLVAVRIVRRDDIGVLGKVLWIVAILVIPLDRPSRLLPLGRRAAADDVAGNETEGQGFEPWKSLHP